MPQGAKKSGAGRPFTSSFSMGGSNVATTSMDKKRNFSTTVNPNSQDYQTYTAAGSGLTGLLGKLSTAMDVSPEARDKYTQDLFNPVAGQINSEYDRQVDQSVNRFGAMGGLNSLGFNRFVTDRIEKNRARALSDAMSGASVAAYDLPGKITQPIINAIGVNDAVQGNAFNRVMAAVNPAFQGYQVVQNNALQQQQVDQQKPKGFLSSLF